MTRHHPSLSVSRNLEKIVDFAQVMMKYHFESSQQHFNCVMHITKLLSLRYNAMFADRPLPKEDLDLVCIGASLHDIGLIAIPDRLLRKKGPLSEEEKQAYRAHVETGAKIIDQVAEISRLSDHERSILRDICLYHHERHDGSGYPHGLRGDEIPLCARIVSVAEVYAALTADNYSVARSHEEAMNMILEGKCGTFDPDVLSCMEKASADLQTLLECSSNDERSFLLKNTYGSSRRSYWKQVGPRPPLPREVEQYSRYAEMRLSVTPGLTCIWQVQPKRDDICFDQWLDMDIAYIGTRSVQHDITLLFKTVLAVLRLSGS